MDIWASSRRACKDAWVTSPGSPCLCLQRDCCSIYEFQNNFPQKLGFQRLCDTAHLTYIPDEAYIGVINVDEISIQVSVRNVQPSIAGCVDSETLTTCPKAHSLSHYSIHPGHFRNPCFSGGCVVILRLLVHFFLYPFSSLRSTGINRVCCSGRKHMSVLYFLR